MVKPYMYVLVNTWAVVRFWVHHEAVMIALMIAHRGQSPKGAIITAKGCTQYFVGSHKPF